MFGGVFPNRGIGTTVQRDLHARTVNGLNLLERDRAIEQDRCVVLNLDPIAHRETKTIIAAKGLQVAYQGTLLGPITLSLGVAVYPDQGLSGHAVLRAADAALYQSKANGRDCVTAALQIAG